MLQCHFRCLWLRFHHQESAGFIFGNHNYIQCYQGRNINQIFTDKHPDLPIEEQDIDDKTYDILEEMLSKIDKNAIQDIEDKDGIQEGSAEFDSLKNENLQLKELTERLKKENSKIVQIKDLVQDYKDELNKKTKEIEELKAQNEDLLNSIKKAPKLIRKLYFKEFESKLLK